MTLFQNNPQIRVIIMTVVTLLTVFSIPGWVNSAVNHKGFGESIELFQKDTGNSFQVSSHSHNKGDAWIIKPGERKILAEIEGPAVIRNIWFTLGGLFFENPDCLYTFVIRMYWDDEDSPSVEVPFGAFFGNGFNRRSMWISQYLGATSGGYYSYLPMPFHKKGKIEIENTGDRDTHVFFHFLCQRYENLPENTLYFHAQWRRENPTTRGKNYTILNAQGDGYFAGVLLYMQGYEKGDKLNFLEGDEYMYIDGETDASVKGTGCEDYFQGGWYFCDGPFNAPYHGLIEKDMKNIQVSCYRFHLLDRVNFSKNIKVEIEHGNRPNNEAKADFSSVAYWYQNEPHKIFSLLPENRVPTVTGPAYILPGAIEWEKISGTRTMYMSTYNGGVSNNLAGLFGKNPGDATDTEITIPVDGMYIIGVNLISHDNGGIVQIMINNTKIGGPIDSYSDDPKDDYLLNANKAMGHIKVGEIKLMAGKYKLTAKISGKNNESKGYEAMIDCITIVPDYNYSGVN